MDELYDCILSDIDFGSVSSVLTFSPSPTDSTLCENIQLIPDTAIEAVEVFTVEISSNDLDVNFLRQSAIVEIQDESTVTIQFTDTVYSVREDDGSIEICAELSGGMLERSIEVNFATQSSSATGVSSQRQRDQFLA